MDGFFVDLESGLIQYPQKMRTTRGSPQSNAVHRSESRRIHIIPTAARPSDSFVQIRHPTYAMEERSHDHSARYLHRLGTSELRRLSTSTDALKDLLRLFSPVDLGPQVDGSAEM